jgi:hypothetical protein
MAQRVCMVVDSAERGLLPDDCYRHACSGFSILHGRQDGSPMHVNPGHDPGGHAKANGGCTRASLVTAHPIRKRESATRGT